MQNEISDRLDRLEKSVRLWRALTASIAIVCISAVCLGSGQAGTDTIKAKKFIASDFEVIDGSGKVVGDIRAVGGGATLTLYGSTGKIQVILGAMGTSGLLVVSDRDGKANVVLRAGNPEKVEGDDEYGSAITMKDHTKDIRLKIEASRDRRVVVEARKAGKVTGHLP